MVRIILGIFRNARAFRGLNSYGSICAHRQRGVEFAGPQDTGLMGGTFEKKIDFDFESITICGTITPVRLVVPFYQS
jgi:hypothetical protein